MSMVLRGNGQERILKGEEVDLAKTKIGAGFANNVYRVSRKKQWLRFVNQKTKVELIVSPDDTHYDTLNYLVRVSHKMHIDYARLMENERRMAQGENYNGPIA